MKKSPWEDLREQAVLGSQAVPHELRAFIRGDELAWEADLTEYAGVAMAVKR